MAREPDYDDDAPWLSSVEEERDSRTFVPQRRLVGGIAVFVVLLAVIIGGIYLVTAGGKQSGSSKTFATPEDAPLIAADPGPYKQPPGPGDPTGAPVDGIAQDVHEASGGKQIAGEFDQNEDIEQPLAVPGTTQPRDLLPPAAGGSATTTIPPVAAVPAKPVARPPVAAPVAEAPKPAPAPAAPKPAPAPVAPKPVAAAPKPVAVAPKPAVAAATPPAKPAGGSVTLQLGAFSSSAKADSVWTDYAHRFKPLAGLSKSVVPVERGGTTLYRLRAAGLADRAAGDAACVQLKAAGADCAVAK